MRIYVLGAGVVVVGFLLLHRYQIERFWSERQQREEVVSAYDDRAWATGGVMLDALEHDCTGHSCDLVDYARAMSLFRSGALVDEIPQSNEYGMIGVDDMMGNADLREEAIEYLGYIATGSELGEMATHNATVIQRLLDENSPEQDEETSDESESESQQQEQESEEGDEQSSGAQDSEGEDGQSQEGEESNEGDESDEAAGDQSQEGSDGEQSESEQAGGSPGEEGEQQQYQPSLSPQQQEQLEQYAEQLQAQQQQYQQYYNKKQPANDQPQDLFEMFFGSQGLRQEVDRGGERDW